MNSEKASPYHTAPQSRCVSCGEKLNTKNVFTPAGWRETRVSKVCKRCFDRIIKR